MDAYTELAFKLGSMSYDELYDYSLNHADESFTPDFKTSEEIRTYLLNKYEEDNAPF